MPLVFDEGRKLMPASRTGRPGSKTSVYIHIYTCTFVKNMNKIYLSIASQRAEVSHVHRGGQHVCTSGSGSSLGGEAPLPVCDEKKQLRGKRGSVSIFVKLQVLDYLNSLSASVSAKETLCMLKFPVLLRCQGQLGRPGSFSDSQNRPMPRLCRFALENNSNNV